jgi:hypothetical protein
MKGFLMLICIFCGCMTIAYILKIKAQKNTPKKAKPKLEIPLKSILSKRKKG